MTNPSIPLQLQQPADENGDPLGRYRAARCGNPTPLTDCRILGARGASAHLELPSGQRRGLAAPGEDNFPFPDRNSFHVSTIPANRGRQRRSPGAIPLRTVWKPQPHCLVAYWLKRLMEPARGESCPLGQRRSLAAPGEDRISSPDEKSLQTSKTTQGGKQRFAGSILPGAVWQPQPHWVVADWLGLMETARGESCPAGQRRGPAPPGEDKFPSPDQKSFHVSTTPTRGRKRRSRSIPPRKVWKPQPNWLVAKRLLALSPFFEEGAVGGKGFPTLISVYIYLMNFLKSVSTMINT